RATSSTSSSWATRRTTSSLEHPLVEPGKVADPDLHPGAGSLVDAGRVDAVRDVVAGEHRGLRGVAHRVAAVGGRFVDHDLGHLEVVDRLGDHRFVAGETGEGRVDPVEVGAHLLGRVPGDVHPDEEDLRPAPGPGGDAFAS